MRRSRLQSPEARSEAADSARSGLSGAKRAGDDRGPFQTPESRLESRVKESRVQTPHGPGVCRRPGIRARTVPDSARTPDPSLGDESASSRRPGSGPKGPKLPRSRGSPGPEAPADRYRAAPPIRARSGPKNVVTFLRREPEPGAAVESVAVRRTQFNTLLRCDHRAEGCGTPRRVRAESEEQGCTAVGPGSRGCLAKQGSRGCLAKSGAA